MHLNNVIMVSFIFLFQKEVHLSPNGTNLVITEEPYADTGYLLFKGSYMKSRKGRLISAFRGITYALARRFEPPMRPLYSNKRKVIIDATKDGKVCPQTGTAGEMAEENCLTLNVYSVTLNPLTPSVPRHLHPVIVYLHDGAFYNGSAYSGTGGPQYLLDKDLVLVTVQYRIGPFGFLSTGTIDSPGNYGLKDQTIALLWVRDYIKNFGGDPECVTIAGSGAGAESVVLHMVSPVSKGLFHRALAMGGSPITQDPLPNEQLHLARKLSKLVECPTENPENIVDCLKSKPYQILADSLTALYEFGYDPVHIWRPVIEKDFGQTRFLTDLPMEIIETGSYEAVPLMIGRTELEYAWRAYLVINNSELLNEMNFQWEVKAPISLELGPNDSLIRTIVPALKKHYLGNTLLERDESSARRLGSAYTDAISGYAIYRLIHSITEKYNNSRNEADILHYYQFVYHGTYSNFYHPDTGKIIGAVHGDELIYVLGMPEKFPLISDDDSEDARIVEEMTERIYLFCLSGNPNSKSSKNSLRHWPMYDKNRHNYLNIDLNSTVNMGLNEEVYTKLWDSFYGNL